MIVMQKTLNMLRSFGKSKQFLKRLRGLIFVLFSGFYVLYSLKYPVSCHCSPWNELHISNPCFKFTARPQLLSHMFLFLALQ